VLTLVGIGVGGARGMGAGAREAISSAKAVYMETFTSPVPREDVEEVRRAAEAGGAAFRLVPRWAVEDGGEILRAAAAGDAALVCYGDPYVATTHTELRARAAAAGTPTRTVHGASALTGVVGECGLHQYKVGRTATVTRAEASTPYDVLRENIDRGCHTVLLLEYDEEGGAFMAPREALAALLAVEGERRALALTRETFAVIASRVGRGDQGIAAGSVAHLMGLDVGAPPHSIVVPGALHFTEADALRALARCGGEPRGNSEASRREAHRMLARYVPMVREAMAAARARGADARVLDCARDYVADAEEFLRRGREGQAILCIGYADGLVDALRIGAGLERGGAQGRPRAQAAPDGRPAP